MGNLPVGINYYKYSLTHAWRNSYMPDVSKSQQSVCYEWEVKHHVSHLQIKWMETESLEMSFLELNTMFYLES